MEHITYNRLNILKTLFFAVVFYVLCFTFHEPVFGAVLYIEPKSGEYRTGDRLIAEIRIDTQGECINTVRADLSFPNNLLLIEDFSLEDSILSHWVERPEITDINKINQEGEISFSGGIPGGYCGRITGDPGLTNILGKIIFRVPTMIVSQTSGNMAEIEFLPESKVFLHDGLGTEADIYTQGARFMISDKVKPTADEWEKKLKEDDIPPEPFIVELLQDPAIFDNKYFIIFWTTDKQTGLDHFGVKEGEKDFKRSDSPYLLEDQTLNSKILVKAVDKAGNERIVEYIPSEHGYIPKPKTKEISFPWWAIILFILGLGVVIRIIWILIKKFSNLKKKGEERGQKTDTEI